MFQYSLNKNLIHLTHPPRLVALVPAAFVNAVRIDLQLSPLLLPRRNIQVFFEQLANLNFVLPREGDTYRTAIQST